MRITGETGTGKEVFASAIHYASRCRDKLFIRINCAAIPSELLKSELFGYEGGSFISARKGGREGKFERANGFDIDIDSAQQLDIIMDGVERKVIIAATQRNRGDLKKAAGELGIHRITLNKK